MALLENRTAPALVIQGGYARHSESRHFENVMLIQSPFGSRGPTLIRPTRPTPISEVELLCHYLRLSLPQFMENDFIYLACAALRHIMSYKSALLKHRPIIDNSGTFMGDKIANMTVKDVKEAVKEDETRRKYGKTAHTHSTGSRYSVAAKFLKAVSTLLFYQIIRSSRVNGRIRDFPGVGPGFGSTMELIVTCTRLLSWMVRVDPEFDLCRGPHICARPLHGTLPFV